MATNTGAVDVEEEDNNDINETVPTLEGLTLEETADQQQHSSDPRLSLLGLPAELRLRIYEHLPILVLSPGPPRPTTTQTIHTTQPSNSSPRHFAILHTNQQIHREARPLIYANIEVPAARLKHIPADAAPHIRVVSVECRWTKGFDEWCCDPALTPLDSLNKWPLENMWRYLGRGFPGVRQLRVRGHVRPGKRYAFPRRIVRRAATPSSSAAAATGHVRRVEYQGLLPEEAEARIGSETEARLPMLQCVVVESKGAAGEEVQRFDHERMPGKFRRLVAEVERLSGGAEVLEEHGWELCIG